jgi:hypothetical protein
MLSLLFQHTQSLLVILLSLIQLLPSNGLTRGSFSKG